MKTILILVVLLGLSSVAWAIESTHDMSGKYPYTWTCTGSGSDKACW